jgi:hypothetical protein
VLLPSDVFQFIDDPDPEIRHFVGGYFGQAHEPVPVSADHLWLLSDSSEPHERWSLLRHLGRLPSTPASRDRLFHALRTETDVDAYTHLCGALHHLPGDDLRRALGDPRITRRMPPDPLDELQQAVELAEQSFEALWTIVKTHPIEIQLGRFLLRPRAGRIHRLALALTRFPERAAQRALDTLLQPTRGERASWEKAFATQLLSYVRHPDAFAPLSRILGGEDLPFVFAANWAEDALVHLGTREVVAKVTAAFPGGGRRFGMNAAGVLGRIKRPESERAALDLLDVTSDMLVRYPLALALCELCTTEPAALAHIRDLVDSDHIDPRRELLEESFLALCAIQGFQPIEAFTWRARRAAQEAARASREAHSTGRGGVDPFLLELLRGEPKRDLN